jgi:hypothetical protein
MIEIKSISQLCIENYDGAVRIIKRSLTSLSARKDVRDLYETLAFTGCLRNSEELTLAIKICRLHNILRSNLNLFGEKDHKLVDIRQLHNERDDNFCISITRSKFHPHGEKKLVIDPMNPHIYILEEYEKTKQVGKFLGCILGLPVAFGFGLISSLISSPTVFIPKKEVYNQDHIFCRNSYHKEEVFEQDALVNFRHGIYTFPKILIQNSITDIVGTTSILQWINNKVYVNARIKKTKLDESDIQFYNEYM